MSLGKKLQIPAGQRVRVLDAPQGFQLDVAATHGPRADAVLLFAKDGKALRTRGELVFVAARAGKLAWIAYAKAGQLDADLNRDVLWQLVKPHGIRPVRQISIDNVWSARRFRPS